MTACRTSVSVVTGSEANREVGERGKRRKSDEILNVRLPEGKKEILAVRKTKKRFIF